MYQSFCKFVLLLFLLVFHLFGCVQGCHFIKNVEMEVAPRSGEPFNTTINSCIERATFNTTIIKVKVKNQHIPNLNKGAVQNMVQLRSVWFDGCGIKAIEPAAFRNVPRLSEIAVIHSPLKKIVKGVFNNLPALDTIRINQNKIDVIEDEAFANIPTLKTIQAAKNKLEYWNSKWFTNSTALDSMDFRHNLIRKIPTKAFQHLSSMSRIYLDYNEIAEIEPGAFDGIHNLGYLGLKHNYLTTIEPNIFPEGLRIDWLMIDANKLNFFSHGVLDKVSVANITFEGNPWKCSCLQTIFYWVNQKNVSVKSSPFCDFTNIPICTDSKTYSNTCIEIVDEEVTETYLETVKEATKDNKEFISNKCVRFD